LSAGESLGEDGASEERMLCKVFARSLEASQLLAKSEEPKGLVFNRLALCGIDPALRRESNAAFDAAAPADACPSRAGVLD
jgi:hypothetical protein